MAKRGLTFGRWLKEQRMGAGLTQDEVATKTGLHKVTISKIENGQSVTEETAAILAEAVGAPREEAVLLSLNVELPATQPASAEERELRRIIQQVPPEKRSKFLRTVREMANMTAA